MKVALAAGALALASLLCGCGPQTYVIQQYDGPVRDSEAIAILRINADDPARVISLDGEYADPRIDEGTRLHIELLPGPHSLRVANGAHPETSSRSVWFEAQAGRVYRVVLEASGNASHVTPSENWGHLPSRQHEAPPAQVFEVDRGSDRLLRRVTAPARAPLAPARPAPAPLPLPAAVPAPPADVLPAAPSAVMPGGAPSSGSSAPAPAPSGSGTPVPSESPPTPPTPASVPPLP